MKNKNVNVGITASTGIAATHLNGRTIHSWCGLGVRDKLDKKDIKELLMLGTRDFWVSLEHLPNEK